MKKIHLDCKTGSSNIYIGESIDNLENYIDISNTIIITDENVNRLYEHRFPDCYKIIIGTGESVKTHETLLSIYDKFLEYNAGRKTFILGIGGGIVCDITGFAASTFNRGMRFGFLASSLLAQVDASIGGKNGINYSGYKNLIGSFKQPEFVIIDPELLTTLPEREYRTGFAEIIKSSLIDSVEFFEYLEDNIDYALKKDMDVLSEIIFRTASVKANIVGKDDTEKGIRTVLNFGHTFGHAIEKSGNQYTHGEAVSIGMSIALKISMKELMLRDEITARIENLLRKTGLPVDTELKLTDIVSYISKDKKRNKNKINFVLLNDIGYPVIAKIKLDYLEIFAEKNN